MKRYEKGWPPPTAAAAVTLLQLPRQQKMRMLDATIYRVVPFIANA